MVEEILGFIAAKLHAVTYAINEISTHLKRILRKKNDDDDDDEDS